MGRRWRLDVASHARMIARSMVEWSTECARARSGRYWKLVETGCLIRTPPRSRVRGARISGGVDNPAKTRPSRCDAMRRSSLAAASITPWRQSRPPDRTVIVAINQVCDATVGPASGLRPRMGPVATWRSPRGVDRPSRPDRVGTDGTAHVSLCKGPLRTVCWTAGIDRHRRHRGRGEHTAPRDDRPSIFQESWFSR